MPRKIAEQSLLAAFPLDDTSLALVFSQPLSAEAARKVKVRLTSGLRVKRLSLDGAEPTRLKVATAPMAATRSQVDQIVVDGPGLRGPVSRRSVRFAHGIVSPTDIRVRNFDSTFPYASTLVGVHVSVECCTGCNGGVHDRHLVVLNQHVGGPWTGIWVRTPKTIDAPYPRWQKVRCAGGVIEEHGGSTNVVDRGWMQVSKQYETPHHAPPPLPIETADLSNERNPSLLAKGLDAAWVELSGVEILSSQLVEASKRDRDRLTRNVVTLRDRSGSVAEAWLYQPSGLRLRQGDAIAALRGFVHAERSAFYVLLSDKEEDIRSV